jgi:uncharacterized protein (DUF1697 family)
MTTCVALLRAINLPRHNQVAMADLRAFLAGLGFTDPRSLLQSGNLLFRSDSRTTAQLERLLETEAAKRLALRTDFLVRTAREWQDVIARNPFREEAKRDPGHLVVMFLKAAPEAKAVKALQAAIKGPELVRAHGRQAYITYPDGIGRSRLTAAMIEAKLGTRGTARNWNTVVKLGTLSSASGGGPRAGTPA